MKANTPAFHPSILPQPLLDLHHAFAQQQSPQAAWDIVKEYFFCFGPAGPQVDWWQMLAAALTHKDMPVLKKPVNRHNLLFCYEFTLVFTQAVSFLLQQQKEQQASSEPG